MNGIMWIISGGIQLEEAGQHRGQAVERAEQQGGEQRAHRVARAEQHGAERDEAAARRHVAGEADIVEHGELRAAEAGERARDEQAVHARILPTGMPAASGAAGYSPTPRSHRPHGVR